MVYLFISLGILVFLFFAFSFVCYYITFYSPQKGQNDIDNIPKGGQFDVYREEIKKLCHDLDKVEYEEVATISYDNKKLVGKYYHMSDENVIYLFFHGYRGMGVRDFGGGAKERLNEGKNIIIVDERAHGKSEGHTITFGIKERYDCISWINYCISRFGKDIKIVLTGISMGAGTVLFASALDLPKNVIGIIADCPFTTPKEIIMKVVKEDMHLPSKFIYFFIKSGALIFGNFNPSLNTLQEIKKSKTKTLIIHGEEDKLVPCEMSRRLEKESDMIHLETVPNAGHGLSYIVNRDLYLKYLDEFAKEINLK